LKIQQAVSPLDCQETTMQNQELERTGGVYQRFTNRAIDSQKL